jgi:glycosyltransferase involved in cell wall biosynthesis
VVMTARLHDDAALRGAYVTADAVLVATRADNYPVVTLEALACGVPVVGAAVGGVVEQIEPGVTGWLTRAGDAEAMGTRAATLLGDDAGRRAMSVAARAWAERHADQRTMASSYAQWFVEVVRG